MKLHSFIYEIIIFSLIFFFCLIPPLFFIVPNENFIFSQWIFPYKPFLLFIFSVIFYYFLLKNKFSFHYYSIFSFIFCFSLLFLLSLIIKIISFFMESDFSQNTIQVILPENFFQWIFCILNFLFSSFYEEIIYRAYFPDELSIILGKIDVSPKFSKIILFSGEIITMLLFAFSHYYLGILSVINAAIAHIILRIFYKQKKDVLPCFLAHFFYNIISLILL